MKPWHIVFPRARTGRGLAASSALSRAGIPVCLWVADQSPYPLPGLGHGERALIIDYDPESGQYEKKWRNAECLFAYCAGFSETNTHDIVDWCRHIKKPHVWESVPPWLSGEYDAETLLFPPLVGPDPDPDNPCRRSSIPIVGVLRELISHRIQRRVQQEYLALPPKKAELLLLVESTSDRNMHNRAKGVDVWYVPNQEGGSAFPCWSQELTSLLILGARIAAVSPPPLLTEYVRTVEGLNDALAPETQMDPDKANIAALLKKIDRDFVAAISIALNKNHSKEVHPWP